jgi:hypothetical protein
MPIFADQLLFVRNFNIYRHACRSLHFTSVSTRTIAGRGSMHLHACTHTRAHIHASAHRICRYTKALDSIKKFRKEQVTKCTTYKAELSLMKEKVSKVQDMTARFNETEANIAVCKSKSLFTCLFNFLGVPSCSSESFLLNDLVEFFLAVPFAVHTSHI